MAGKGFKEGWMDVDADPRHYLHLTDLARGGREDDPAQYRNASEMARVLRPRGRLAANGPDIDVWSIDSSYRDVTRRIFHRGRPLDRRHPRARRRGQFFCSQMLFRVSARKGE